MKKMLTISAILTLLLLSSSVMFAQLESKGDTLLIGPLNAAGQALGALNEAIKNDTTTSGDRVHKVYKLQRGAQYILTEILQLDFLLVLVADKPDDANRPPIVRAGLKADGGAVGNLWHIFDNATFKNLWIFGSNLDGTGPISWIIHEVKGSGKKINFEGCIFETPYTWWGMFLDNGGNNVYKINDCIFKNIGAPSGADWNGAVFASANMDSIIVKNTTYFNFGAFAVNGGDGSSEAFYAEIDHCTFVNSMVHPINSHGYVIKKYTNNLFVNTHAFGDDDQEIQRHFDQGPKGLMNYAEVQMNMQKVDSLFGPGGVRANYDPNGDGKLTEGEFVWELKNNNWFYTAPVKNYQVNDPTITPTPWMNDYNAAMFNSNTDAWAYDLKIFTWADSAGNIVDPPAGFDTLHIVDSAVVAQSHEGFQYFVDENTTNVDPGFANLNNTDELLAQNCANIRTERSGGTVGSPVKFHNVADYLAFTWPLEFDLSYSNTALQTAGTDGLPLGDLNWWPNIVGVEKIDNVIVDKYSIEQNYPNPFNPTTNIEFAIPTNGMVSLKVFNVLGEEVADLLNKELASGSYNVNFDATQLTSGIYFYTLTRGNFVQTRKMLLLK